MFRYISGLPHTQGVIGNSENFQVIEILRETQENSGNSEFFLYSGKLRTVLILTKVLR